MMLKQAPTIMVIGFMAAGLMFVTGGCGGDKSGVTTRPHHVEVTSADVHALDAYAEELGLVMNRAQGPDPKTYARRVDGPGRDIETLVLSGSAYDEGAEIVLRIRLQRTERGWFGGGSRFMISACYRWVLETANIDGHRPERLSECPDVPVTKLGPEPPEPSVPDGLVELVEAEVTPTEPLSEAAVLRQVRAIYRELSVGYEPGSLLSVEDALAADSVATHDDAIGVAVGAGSECVMVRVTREDVTAWVPPAIALEPGEVGCDAHAVAAAAAATRP